MWDQLTGLIPGLQWTMVLVYLRVQACVLILPGLGERVVSVRIRVAVAMAVTPLLAAGLADVPVPQTQIGMMAQGVTEMVIGIATGGLLRILAWAIDMASTAIATTTSLSQIVGVSNSDAPHPLGNILHMAGIAALMAMGLPIMVMHLIADGLVLWPPGGPPEITVLASHAIRVMGDSFILAMLMAAPFTLGGFLFQALSGVINRIMPALPMLFITSPGTILLAIMAAAILSPLLIEMWANAVLDFTLPSPR